MAAGMLDAYAENGCGSARCQGLPPTIGGAGLAASLGDRPLGVGGNLAHAFADAGWQNAQLAPRPPSPVEAATAAASAAIDELEKSVSALAAKLGPVLPANLAASGGDAQPKPAGGSPLCRDIMTLADRARQLSAVVRDLTASVEL